MLMPLDMLRAGEWAEVEEVTGQPAWVGRLRRTRHPPGVPRASGSTRFDVLAQRCWLQTLFLRGGECSQILVRPVSAETEVGKLG